MRCRLSPTADVPSHTSGAARCCRESDIRRRSEASNPSTSACFLLLVVGWRPSDAASALDLATSENRQSAAYMKRRYAPCNDTGDRRMIDVAFDLATREPSARRHDRFSKGKPVALRIGSVHAIKCDQVASVVAYSHAYDNVELPCLRNSSGNDCICFGQSQGHGTKSLVAFQAYLDIPHRREVVLHQSKWAARLPEWGQTRTSSLAAARPLPPSADIGPGGQSVGQAAHFRARWRRIRAARRT